ncbi:hypothetical protein Tco_1028695 [Tanacetum coccineum]|uniref:MAK10-like protein n=1 Tax=Tanacetum coccineum TaxID=301880 RepID=A0ABQ5G2W4_9ASTR
MDSFQGLTTKSPSSWHRPLAPSLNFYDYVNPVTRRTIDQSAGGKLCDLNAEESWAFLEDLDLYENESWNDPMDFAKLVKAIALPQDVLSTSDCRLIELKNQVQCLMEAHLALKKPTQVNKITTSCEIYSGPHDTQYCMEDPEQAFVEYTSPRTDKAGGKWYTFKPEQNNIGDTYNPSWRSHPNLRLSKFESDFKRQQGKMTNKIDTVKAITDRIVGALPSDTVKNSKLKVNSTTLVLSSRSYPTEDSQCSTHTYGSINTITIHPKQQSNSHKSKAEEEDQKREGNPEYTDNFAHNEQQRDTPQLGMKDTTVVDNLGSNGDDEGIEWLDVEEPLDLVDTSEESVYESLIKEMPKCSLNYDFRIKKDPERSELSSEGHDLLLSRIILSEDDYDRGCRKPSDLEDRFYRHTIKLGPEYLIGMDDEGEVT